MFKRMGDFMASVSTAASNLSLDRLRDDAPPVAATFAELNLSKVSPRVVGEAALRLAFPNGAAAVNWERFGNGRVAALSF
jgi:hypothetical protein